MILIPEIETVVILVPRTGSGSLRRAIAAAYPRSMLLYRHMEADGVPQGYDRWRKVGVVRHPTERLWSLYKFLQEFDGQHDPAYIASMRASVRMPFSDWILNNQTPFTTPYDSADLGRFWPGYAVRHSLPENRKSQFMYLRPDLGTKVFPFANLAGFGDYLGVDLDRHNATVDYAVPILTPEAEAHMHRCFRWDFVAARGVRI